MWDAVKPVVATPVGFPQSVIDDGFMEEDEWDETLAEINLDFRENIAQPSASGHTYKYRNVPIQFPYRAYKSQRQMMEKIIEGVTTGENCLLESPTGTGKTAALLCSLLGWQRDCYERKDNCSSVIEAAAERLGGCSCGLIQDKERTTVVLFKKKKDLFLRAMTTWDSQSEADESPPVSALNSKTSPPAINSTKPVPSSPELNSTKPVPSSPVRTSTNTPPSSPVKTPTKALPLSPSCSTTPPAVKFYHSPASAEPGPSPRKRHKQSEEVVEKHINNACAYCVRKYVVDKSRPPRIYYCTRTHSQITQVVKQLKATAYQNTKMTVLAGREPTCINERALKIQQVGQMGTQTQVHQSQPGEEPINLNDHCRTLRKNYFKIQKIKENNPEALEKLREDGRLPPVCKHFGAKNDLLAAFSGFQRGGAWDLEDIKREGEDCGMCPFYGCQALQDNSDIIFGSYNYLLMPDIREAKNVKYINSVLVFDEAHNIEDICRKVYSFGIEVDKFDKSIRELVDSMIIKGQLASSFVHPHTIKGLQEVSVTFKRWSDKIKEWGNREVEIRGNVRDKIKVNDISKPYESEELKKTLIEMDMTACSVTHLLKLIKSDDEEEEVAHASDEEEYYLDSRGQRKPFRLSSTVGEFLKNIRQTLVYLCAEETEGIGGIKDFKGYLTGVANPSRKSLQNQSDDSRRSRAQARPQAEGPEYFFKLEIICLNPAIGFRHLRNTAYSIIVASGTLTPLNSFASELATKFKVTLQADHVIPTSNVWAGVISTGPSNQDLKLIREHQDDTAVQDDLGRIICDICYAVPNGVLVFFPSYSLKNKLEDRWRAYPLGNSIFNQIQKRKMIFYEESKDKQAFKLNMERYKEYVKGGTTWDGCILFAVFRGKISEGIDFADEQARAVVTIGIPYSNLKAADIVSKKNYNNMRRKTLRPGETFLSGPEWYTTQAFRAMNQGFGRCVRHCDDWGALILIDSRLASHRHDSYISSWIRKNLRPYNTFSEVKSKLAKFINDMKTRKTSSREHIQIAYDDEEEDLDSTEVVEYSEDGEMDSQDDLMLTQIASLHDSYNVHNLTTQRIPMSSSTPLPPQRDLSNVAESSPEYSFSEELEEVLGSMPSPIAPVAEVNSTVIQEDDGESDSSVSIFERTPSNHGSDDDAGNDSDMEMFGIADRLESSVDEELSQNQSQNVQRHNQSDILDVSMPSVSDGMGESEMSQTSDISYHSEWDTSVN